MTLNTDCFTELKIKDLRTNVEVMLWQLPLMLKNDNDIV